MRKVIAKLFAAEAIQIVLLTDWLISRMMPLLAENYQRKKSYLFCNIVIINIYDIMDGHIGIYIIQ